MTLSDVASIVMVIVGLLLALPAYWLATHALFPAAAERARGAFAARPGKTLCVGIGGAIALGLAVAFVGALPLPLFKVAALLGFGVILGLGLFGAGSLASLIGGRMPSPADAATPWRATVRGGAVLELSYLLPVLGWFLILPLSLVGGLGAALTAVLSGGPAAKVPTAAPAAAPVTPAPHPEVAGGAPSVPIAEMGGQR